MKYLIQGEVMDAFYIKGEKPLIGEITIGSAKNACLPILAASLMCDGELVVKNCAYYTDIENMISILDSLGCNTNRRVGELYIDPRYANIHTIREDYTKKVRSSIFMLGSLLTKFKKAHISYPGGCNIGTRPIDLHLKGLKTLGVKISEKHGYIDCDGSHMRAGVVHLDFPSVGATENIMMAAVKLKGVTEIHNAAKEPEIEDLQNFINSMGGKICGAGSSTITIKGVDKLHSTTYTPISDRIVAGTYMIAGVMTRGKIKLNNVMSEHNMALISKLKQAGSDIQIYKNSVEIKGNGRPRSCAIETQPYPGFPTDLQNQMFAMMTISDGCGIVVENLFETRYKIYGELTKMGANITIRDRTALIKGVENLYGANVVASDLRGGAALVLAGLVARGYTTVEDVYHIDRGYKNIECDLQMLGADIERIIK